MILILLKDDVCQWNVVEAVDTRQHRRQNNVCDEEDKTRLVTHSLRRFGLPSDAGAVSEYLRETRI